MKTITINILILLFFLCACKKEDDRKAVTAGVYDSTFNYHDFNPVFKISLKFDSLSNTNSGADSIDFDLDGNFDLIINQRILLAANPLSHITSVNYPFCRLTLKNGLEVAIKNEIYGIGLGQTSNLDWVDTIQYKGRIDNLSNWSNANTKVWMYVVPPTIYWGSNGCWYNFTNTERYVGIRMKINSRFKFGWIRVNELSSENILFISYALEE